MTTSPLTLPVPHVRGLWHCRSEALDVYVAPLLHLQGLLGRRGEDAGSGVACRGRHRQRHAAAQPRLAGHGVRSLTSEGGG